MKTIKYIPFQHIHPPLKQRMIEEFRRFYDDQFYILGSGLKKFEEEYAEFNEVKHAIGIGNGYDALWIALKCLGIGKSDEVIVPAHTFIATALAVLNVGAKPVLGDVDENTFTLSPKTTEDLITEKTKAIIPVHLYGNVADMGPLMEIAQKNSLFLIEDNAQAQDARYQGKPTGSMGIMNATSFYPGKNIGAFGDGGMVTTNSDELAEKARMIRNYGKDETGIFAVPGINSRLDELQARLLSVKLPHLRRWNEERMEIAALYEKYLKNIDEIQLQATSENGTNVRHIFPVVTSRRDELKKWLQTHGIQTGIHYDTPIHLHPALSFLGHKKGQFPIAEKVCDQELSLPNFPGLTEEDIKYVCEKIEAFFAGN